MSLLTQSDEIILLKLLQKNRRIGEKLMETARRMLTVGAMEYMGGHQRDAAKMLGVTPRVVNYWAKDLRIRPMDKKAKDA